MDAAQLKQRTQRFALDIIRYTGTLPNTPSGWTLGKQLLRSATSVGANYRAACRARSKADFLSKITIVEEEADETMYWLELIQGALLADALTTQRLLNEANEITAIMTASGKTAKAGLRRR